MDENTTKETTAQEEKQNTEAKADTDEKQAKTFTQEEVNKIVSDRLSRENKVWEERLNEKVTEAEKLAKMNAEQKAEYEQTKRENELQKREADITKRELKATAKEHFAEKELPLELAECLNYEDAESCNASIEAVEKAFLTAVERRVNEKLRGTPPKSGGAVKEITKEEFNKMDYAERIKFKTEQPEAYQKMMGGSN